MERVAILLGVLLAAGCAPRALERGRTKVANREPTPAAAPGPAAAPALEPAPAPALARPPAPAPVKRGTCPVATRGTNVGTEDIQRGIALVFTTSDDIAGLRKAVTALHLAPPNTVARFDNVDGGVRVVFEAADVTRVRREIHERGRVLAERCGLSLGVVPLHAPKPEPVAEPAAPPPSAPTKDDAPKSEKPKADAPKKGAPNPPPPADATKPKEGGQPKEDAKPKEREKPNEPDKPKEGPKAPWQLSTEVRPTL